MESAESYADACKEIEDAILDDPGDFYDLIDGGELAEWIEVIASHREAKKRGPAMNWEPGDGFWERVHGL
ncbi:MAG: hypothetical protein GY871_01015 [Actinomycetales bacterium]|nr:hypothetical protein [Actinomycetales bacterium]